MNHHHFLYQDFLKSFALGPSTKVETPAWTQQDTATVEEVVSTLLNDQEQGEMLATMLAIVEMVARGHGHSCREIAIDLRERIAREYAETHCDAAFVEAREMGAAA